MLDYIDMTLPFDGSEIKFRLLPLKRKKAMLVAHKFIGHLQEKDGNITMIPFEVLDEIAQSLFTKSFINTDEGPKEIKDYSEFFEDKIDLFYQAIGEGIRVNCPDLFTRLEKASQ